MSINWHKIGPFLRSTTTRLALSYLAIIMVMSIGFSYVFYRTSWHELGRQVPPPSSLNIQLGSLDPNNLQTTTTIPDDEYHNFFKKRIEEGRDDLLAKLIVLNSATLVVGAGLSYYLARRTLQPIQRAMDAQARFVSDASHELRTPLAIIQAENEVALRKSELTLTRAKELLASNLEEAMRLKQLSEDLLRLAREDNKDMQLQPVWLQDIATEAVNHVMKSAQAKNIAITDSLPHLQVMADLNSISQVLVILLDNAVKYSGKKTTVALAGRSVGKFAEITVTDQGRGIDPDHLPHIFERFYRTDKSRNKQEADGYGLGLAIAYSIVRQHHGSLAVTSQPGKGSTFTVKLPLATVSRAD